MNPVRLVCLEAWHRRWSAALTVLVIAFATATVVFFVTIARAGADATRVIQRDIGLNVIILPADANRDQYWSRGWTDATIPAAYIDRLADQAVANRLIPLVTRGMNWDGTEIMVVGIGTETFKGGAKKKPVFAFRIEPGTIVVGAEVAAARGLAVGDTVELLDRSFQVADVLARSGSAEDIRVYLDLTEAQQTLGIEDQVSEIQALECHCGAEVADPLARLQDQLETLLPGTQVIRRASLADARRSQRLLAEQVLVIAAPIIVGLAALVIAGLAAMNVRDRRIEIGLYSAVGYGASMTAALFLGRALLLGMIGGLIGYGVGWIVLHETGPALFNARSVEVGTDLLGLVAIGAPAFAAVAALIPVSLAMTQDPAVTLRES